MNEVNQKEPSGIRKRSIRYANHKSYFERLFKPKRVAVYSRVSRKSERSHNSIENQKTFLQESISSRPNWEFVGFYIDDGVTGTKLNRPEFNRMIHDAKDGKIDIIYTKSISRFGRNLTASLNIIHELLRYDVEIIFSSQNLHISNNNPISVFSLQFQLLQAELTAKNNSENQKWSIRNRFAKGLPPSNNKLYGYSLKSRELFINPVEAEVVKRIYSMYLSGKGRRSICRQLNADGIPSPTGIQWKSSTILSILSNEKYTGNMMLQKSFIKDSLTKKKVKNNGEVTRYYIENDHEAIIDQFTFNAVQAEIARRSAVYGKIPPGTFRRPPYQDPILITNNYFAELKRKSQPPAKLFYHLLYCPYCNAYYYHSRVTGGKNKYRELWQCRDYMQLGSAYCPNKCIKEEILIKHTRDVLLERKLIKKSTKLTNNLLACHIKQILSKKSQILEFHLQNGEIVTKHWRINRYKSWTPEMRERARQQTLKRLAAEGVK